MISGGSGDAAAVSSSWTKVSLAGTFALDSLTEQARNAGAKVVLVGGTPPGATEPCRTRDCIVA